MKKIIISGILFAINIFTTIYAQEFLSGVKCENLEIERNDSTGMVDVSFIMTIDKSAVESNNSLVITPMLKGQQVISLPVILIKGKRYIISEKRRIKSGYTIDTAPDAFLMKMGETGKYASSVPYADWMDNVDFVLYSVTKGCCESLENELVMLDSRLSLVPGKSAMPDFKPSFIVPETEAIKSRNIAGAAYLDFKVGRWEILPEFQNNATELEKINILIDEVKNDPYTTLINISISGYASPDGTQVSNQTLSAQRANSLKEYVRNKHGINDNLFTVAGNGEDWVKLDSLIAQSDFVQKEEILNIIRGGGTLDAKDNSLSKIDGGKLYKQLKDDIFPLLRRTEYVMDYTVMTFTRESAKEAFKTNPSNLSLNEMFIIAQEYAAGSEEFNNIFETAAEIYTQSDIANINAAASALTRGDVAAANKYLSKVTSETPEFYNNMGIRCFLSGETEKAFEYFEKAGGNSEAINNVEELKKSVNPPKYKYPTKYLPE